MRSEVMAEQSRTQRFTELVKRLDDLAAGELKELEAMVLVSQWAAKNARDAASEQALAALMARINARQNPPLATADEQPKKTKVK